MIDLSSPRSLAGGALEGARFTKDASAGRALVFEVKLVFTVVDEQDADVVDKTLRGARAYFAAVKDTEAKGDVKLTPVDLTGRLVVVASSSGVVVVDAAAEIVSVAMTKAAKVVTYTVKAKLRGLAASVASHLAESLGDKLSVEWEAHNAQLTLPFAAPAQSNAVQVVTAQIPDPAGGPATYVFGIQTGVKGDLLELDDFGTTYVVPLADVTSKVILAPESGTTGPSLTDVVEPYNERVRAAGATPSWQHVIVGIASVRGVELESGVYKVTAAELEASVHAAVANTAN